LALPNRHGDRLLAGGTIFERRHAFAGECERRNRIGQIERIVGEKGEHDAIGVDVRAAEHVAAGNRPEIRERVADECLNPSLTAIGGNASLTKILVLEPVRAVVVLPKRATEDQVNRLLLSLWLLGAALITGSALVSMHAIFGWPYGTPKIDTLNAAATAPGQERAALPQMPPAYQEVPASETNQTNQRPLAAQTEPMLQDMSALERDSADSPKPSCRERTRASG
jgi:hypothetical protein